MTDFVVQYEYSNACTGSVSIRTNGPQGGDSGHGGFLDVTFKTDNGSTALSVDVDGKRFSDVSEVKLNFLGDAEMKVASEMFRFLADKLAGRV